jgi:hypothetical protein
MRPGRRMRCACHLYDGHTWTRTRNKDFVRRLPALKCRLRCELDLRSGRFCVGSLTGVSLVFRRTDRPQSFRSYHRLFVLRAERVRARQCKPFPAGLFPTRRNCASSGAAKSNHYVFEIYLLRNAWDLCCRSACSEVANQFAGRLDLRLSGSPIEILGQTDNAMSHASCHTSPLRESTGHTLNRVESTCWSTPPPLPGRECPSWYAKR